jgi:methylated-DNA-[protein]-cysteine S-methyltransferase
VAVKRSLGFQTELGPLTITADDEAVLKISFRLDPLALDETPLLRRARKELQDFASGKRRDLTFPHRADGTVFQKKIWSALKRVPFGRLLSYGELAEKAGYPGAARAVGGAVGSNPLPFVIPCHRVIASGKRLGGFGPGPGWKKKLLTLEGSLEGLRG